MSWEKGYREARSGPVAQVDKPMMSSDIRITSDNSDTKVSHYQNWLLKILVSRCSRGLGGVR